jgi:hypothetical protein
MTFTRVSVIVAITAVAVYLGLNYLFPRNLPEKPPSTGLSVAQVFGGSDQAAGAPAAGSQQTAPSAAPAADQTAVAPVPSAPEPAGQQSEQSLSEEEVRKIAADVGRKVATQVAQSAIQQQETQTQTAQAASASAASPAPAAPSPPSGAAPTESSPAPAQTQTAPAPPAEHAAKRESRKPAANAAAAPANAAPKSAAHSRAQTLPATDAISAWWPVVDKPTPDHLNLVYAGEAAFEKAVVLLFDSDMGNPTLAASHIRVLDDRGQPAPGTWELSPSNPRMMIFKTKPGRYTVVLSADLANAQGKTLGSELHGPVYVH